MYLDQWFHGLYTSVDYQHFLITYKKCIESTWEIKHNEKLCFLQAIYLQCTLTIFSYELTILSLIHHKLYETFYIQDVLHSILMIINSKSSERNKHPSWQNIWLLSVFIMSGMNLNVFHDKTTLAFEWGITTLIGVL